MATDYTYLYEEYPEVISATSFTEFVISASAKRNGF